MPCGLSTTTCPHRHPAHGACRTPTLRPSVLRPNAAIRMPIATIWAKVRAKRGERSNIFCRLRVLIRFRHIVPMILNHISILRVPKESTRLRVPKESPRDSGGRRHLTAGRAHRPCGRGRLCVAPSSLAPPSALRSLCEAHQSFYRSRPSSAGGFGLPPPPADAVACALLADGVRLVCSSCAAARSYPCGGFGAYPIVLQVLSPFGWPRGLFVPPRSPIGARPRPVVFLRPVGCAPSGGGVGPLAFPASCPRSGPRAPGGTPLPRLSLRSAQRCLRRFLSAGARCCGSGSLGFPLGAVAQGFPPAFPPRVPTAECHCLSPRGGGLRGAERPSPRTPSGGGTAAAIFGGRADSMSMKLGSS